MQCGVPFNKITRSFDHVVLQGHVNYLSCYATATIRHMATKRAKVVTYYKKTQSIKSNHPLNTWSYGLRDKLRTFYLHEQCLWLPNLTW